MVLLFEESLHENLPKESCILVYRCNIFLFQSSEHIFNIGVLSDRTQYAFFFYYVS